MFSHRFEENVNLKTYIDWFLLSFLAGNINTGGYLACHRFVSHVTGFATLAGISLEEKSWLDAFGALTIPLFFLLGVMVSGFLTETNRSSKIHGQKYAPVMWLVALLIGVVAVLGSDGYFGVFGETVNVQRDYVLLACLCGACGLQNAAISSASGSTIRTTHLTGITTDLGLGLVKAEIGKLSQSEKQQERRANLLRIATIGSFTFGSFVGAIMYIRYHYQGFVFPMLIAVYSAWMARKSRH